MIKYFRFSYEYVLWGISFTNLCMLLGTIPVYQSPEEKKKTQQGSEDDSLADIFKDEI